eukprot:GHVR01166178.1.p1 GENE.GHVR01166178.1~~GHVR01166178.1.p1  ORF type:complete len:126 (-),score=28.60 GHVR01166178.1:175-552(-)
MSGTQPIRALRVLYFFVKDIDDRLGTVSVDIRGVFKQCLMRKTIQQNFKSQHYTLSKVTVGMTADIKEDIQSLKVTHTSGVCVPPVTYTAPDPLPDIWLELLPKTCQVVCVVFGYTMFSLLMIAP